MPAKREDIIKWSKIGGITLAIIYVIIIIVRNWVTVETDLLFVVVPLPRVVLIVGMLAVGFLSGILFQSARARRNKA